MASLFLIAKPIKGITGDVKPIKKLTTGNLLVEDEKPHQMNDLQITKIGDVAVKVEPQGQRVVLCRSLLISG